MRGRKKKGKTKGKILAEMEDRRLPTFEGEGRGRRKRKDRRKWWRKKMVKCRRGRRETKDDGHERGKGKKARLKKTN